MAKYIVGIDEAGRGPLAGPVAVGIVVAPERYDISSHFPGVADSKKLSEKKREELYLLLQKKSKEISGLQFVVMFASAKIIDAKGISFAIRDSIRKGLEKLTLDPDTCHIQLDGLLHAPKEYLQETIIKGDALVPIISLASIAAKVERDRLMKKLSTKYPEYGFEIHKGYGTQKHRAAIQKYGPSAIHRTSWNLYTKSKSVV